jgi:NADPH:quinone reductase-like Zn-dependent oxidoreductase
VAIKNKGNQNMKAILFNQTGSVDEVLQIADIPQPVPGENQVLIKVEASPIQPADVLFIGGHYRVQPVFPQTAASCEQGAVENSPTGALADVVGQSTSYAGDPPVRFVPVSGSDAPDA